MFNGSYTNVSVETWKSRHRISDLVYNLVMLNLFFDLIVLDLNQNFALTDIKVSKARTLYENFTLTR